MDEILDELEILPPLKGTCPECAEGHNPNQPHNKNSLYYQMNFYRRWGRFPSWRDAMAHCSESIQAAWTERLKARGLSPDER